jgi:hypothetical protein
MQTKVCTPIAVEFILIKNDVFFQEGIGAPE